MKGLQLILSDRDYELLVRFYEEHDLPGYNQRKLFTELKEARIVAPENLPLNVVSLNSKVLVWNMDKGQTFTVQIVLPDLADGREGRISVFDTLAVALLGYSSGAVTEWEMPDGINRLKVLSVSQWGTEASAPCF